MKATTTKLFARIAQEHLLIDTLETRNSDSMDFHDVAVWGVRQALEAAYKAGLEAGMAAAVKAQSAPRKD